MQSIEPFFRYMGNKSSIADWIVPSFPAGMKTYVEVFGGTFAIGMNKPKHEIEVFNDFNPHLANLFEVNRVKHKEFIEAIKELHISEYLYNHYWDNHNDYSTFPNLENAVRYFYIMCLTWGGAYEGGWGMVYKKEWTMTFETKLSTLKKIHERTKNLVVLNKDFRKCIKLFAKRPDTLLYLDPPYVGTESYYKHLAGSFTETDHVQLRDLLNKADCYWFLSYEDNEMVNDLYKKYHKLSKMKFRPGTKDLRSAEEVVFTNYKPQNTLFNF